jgi:ubiquinol-cytochrome c reductase cytochrome c subunit
VHARRRKLLAVVGVLVATWVATPLLAAASPGPRGAPAPQAASEATAGERPRGERPAGDEAADGAAAGDDPGRDPAGDEAAGGAAAGDDPALDPAGDGELLDRGRELYVQGCASCHGNEGQGIEIRDGAAGGPSLERSGEASAYYYLSTGRMPLNNPLEQPEPKQPAYSDEDIEALVAYVASLGEGPPLPDVDLAGTDLAAGGAVYRANCQPCHSASGGGGALSYGRAAPRLGSSEPEQIAAAVRIGPGQMPVFDTSTLSDEELDDLVRYVRYLQHPDDPGGLPIGRTGPIPEGFVAWLVGMVALLALVAWIGTRSPVRRHRHG